MFEKIKSAAAYIGIPFLILLGIIWKLFSSLASVKQQLANTQAEKVIDHTVTQMEEAKKDADQKQADFDSKFTKYNRLLDEYHKGNGKLPD